MNIKEVKNKVLSSQLFKDSFWAVFGNGFGNAMLLLAGILIARLLGKDILQSTSLNMYEKIKNI